MFSALFKISGGNFLYKTSAPVYMDNQHINGSVVYAHKNSTS